MSYSSAMKLWPCENNDSFYQTVLIYSYIICREADSNQYYLQPVLIMFQICRVKIYFLF